MAKTDRYTILIVILSVLLAISLIVGSTVAWFTSTDTASQTIVLGDPVELNIVDANNEIIDGDGYDLPITIPASRLLPGMEINLLARVLFTKSNTPALLRAKISVEVQNSSATAEDLATLQTALNTSVKSAVSTTGNYKWVYYATDGWWYYLGVNSAETTVNQSTMERIVCTSDVTAERTVTFVSNSFIFPYYVGNTFANSNVVFDVQFQAVQGYLPAYEEAINIGKNEYVDGAFTGFRYNTIENVVDIFDETFA